MTTIKARTDITANPPILFNGGRCDLCGCCVGVCPPNCITMYETCIEVDGVVCIRCGFCLPACPVGAIDWNENGRVPASIREYVHAR